MKLPGIVLTSILAGAAALAPREAENAPVASDFQFRTTQRDYIILPVTSASPENEAIVVHTDNDLVYVSHDFGAQWTLVDALVDCKAITRSDNDYNKVIALVGSAPNSQVYISWDRGLTFSRLEVPMAPSLRYLPFSRLVVDHPAHPDWLIYHGEEYDGEESTQTAFYSKDRGRTWAKLYGHTDACYWVAEKDAGSLLPELVYCESYDWKSGNLQVFWSTDYFDTQGEIEGMEHLTQVVQDDRFIIGAYGKNLKTRELAVSTDGVHFNRARYPPSLPRSMYGGINIIENKDALLIFENASPSNDYGTLLKSDSEGYELVSMLEKVSRPRYKGGFVDFDRLHSVEGVLLANVVANAKEVDKGADPLLKTVISHSDGAKWAELVGPDGGQLHLHSYTDRVSYRKQPSTPSAVGIFLGRGNEGDHLGAVFQANTYMTRDAGLTWFKIAERPMIWAIGDSGAVIVLADYNGFTDKVSYSLDEGATWQDYTWGYPAYVRFLDTIPSGTGRRFIVMVEPVGAKLTTAIRLDFTPASPRQCTEADFEPWQPEHPQLQTKCLLGRQIEYQRRIRDRNCIVGKYFEQNAQTPGAMRTVQPCACAREDYECDYTHQLDPADNQCKLIPKTTLPTMEEQCRNGAISWKKLTGYRKLAASTCEGEFLEASTSHACPGKEEWFNNGAGNGAGELGPGDGSGSDLPDSPGASPVPDEPERPDNRRGFFGYIFHLIKNLCIIAFAGAVAFAAVHFGRPLLSKYRAVHLPESEDSLDNIHNLWSLLKSYVPFMGSQVPHDHLGFYSRMDDDERYRILEEASEDDFFQDEESVVGSDSTHDPSDSTHDLSDTTHDLSGTTHDLGDTTHDLSDSTEPPGA